MIGAGAIWEHKGDRHGLIMIKNPIKLEEHGVQATMGEWASIPAGIEELVLFKPHFWDNCRCPFFPTMAWVGRLDDRLCSLVTFFVMGKEHTLLQAAVSWLGQIGLGTRQTGAHRYPVWGATGAGHLLGPGWPLWVVMRPSVSVGVGETSRGCWSRGAKWMGGFLSTIMMTV